MSAWLSSWLKDIIFVILLAAFIDLLLPNSSMQRYVKVVISLFILMTILSPVVEALFDIHFEQSAFSELSRVGDGKEAQIKPLSEILADGKRLQQENEQHSRELAEKQVAGYVKSAIEQKYESRVQSVQVHIEQQPGKAAEIKDMEIVLAATTAKNDPAAKKNQEKSGLVHIKPIKPVHINVEGTENAQGETLPVLSEPDRRAEDTDMIRSIKQDMQQEWKIPAGRISVQIVRPAPQ